MPKWVVIFKHSVSLQYNFMITLIHYTVVEAMRHLFILPTRSRLWVKFSKRLLDAWCICRHTAEPSTNTDHDTNDVRQVFLVVLVNHVHSSSATSVTQQPPPTETTPMHGSTNPIQESHDTDDDQKSTSSYEIDILLSDAPFQPATKNIEPQHVGHVKKRVLHFQQGWFQKFQWLHYVPSLQGVLCFTCAKADTLHMVDLANKRDPAFIINGFRNWKKALESFRSHEQNQSHNFSYMQLNRIKQCQPAVNTQLSTQLQEQQAKARDCLRMIFTTAKFLARQGLAFRGHENDEGNFK